MLLARMPLAPPSRLFAWGARGQWPSGAAAGRVSRPSSSPCRMMGTEQVGQALNQRATTSALNAYIFIIHPLDIYRREGSKAWENLTLV